MGKGSFRLRHTVYILDGEEQGRHVKLCLKCLVPLMNKILAMEEHQVIRRRHRHTEGAAALGGNVSIGLHIHPNVLRVL